ncbi:hypothetical protein SAMN05660443_2544 [Marinospirillum celere]|uniref:Uncharacterized protein n=1 Tax=Marinospirillum celere TaxID=1122252 RepID=A0A1I1J3L3_9GAMM|nr:hypothetical protein [Marinospirillum celere]SFC40533.1 hypothetical protein SAMN05660443_2544 [Marinospirillum celere]
MPFQRKLLLIVFLVLIAVLLWPKGQDDLTPSTQDLHEEAEEMEMQTTPETRRSRDDEEALTVDGEEITDEEMTREDQDAALDDLADAPLSQDLDTDEQGGMPASAAAGLSSEDRRYLRERGLDNPEQQVINDLMGQTELLPQDSMTGGNMQFIQEETELLSHRWVLASFSDGQTQGQALYEFEVTPGGDLIWVLLSHYSH